MKIGFITALLLLTFNSFAQFVNFGQDRSSLRWKQIKTDDFQIIYPDFFEENAQKAANIYEKLYQHANTLNRKPKKISVILHADGGMSNGNVAWAPKKSELYTMPPQDPSDSWLEHLCVHEFRHVVQLDKVNQGLTKGFYYIFGEIFPIAVVGVYVPMWFMEGDAVCFETSVGNLGRGRSPEFLNEMKAQVVEKGMYKFYKAILGSYKDYVPNRYIMGYYMTANGRANYGDDIWGKALERTGKRPFSLSPFAKSLQLTMQGKRDSLWNDSTFRSLFIHPDSVKKANTYGDAKRTLYRDNFSELQQIWKKEAASVKSDFDTIPTRNKYYTSYFYPTASDKGELIAYKKGLQQAGAFVRLRNGKEKILVNTGALDDYKFALSQKHIVWSEYKPHLRWQQGGRMTLTSFDLRQKKYKSHKSRNNRVSPFAVGDNWGCVEINNHNEASIVILDSTLQHELWREKAGTDELFIHPSYSNGKITTVIQSPQGIRMENIDVQTHRREKISDNYYYELDNPIQVDSALIFRASFNGNNSFYRQDAPGQQPVNILNAPFGLRFPSVSQETDSIYFSFYTSDGYKPARAKISALKEEPLRMETFRLADTMKAQEDWTLPLRSDSVFKTRRYNKLTHLVNIHSWGPLEVDINGPEVDFGAVVYSQNKLSTLSFTAGYILKSGYDHGAWMLNASYRGWWPIIDFDLKSGRYDENFRTVNATHNQTQAQGSLFINSKAWLSSADITVRLPFNISRKNYNRTLQPYLRYTAEGIHGFRPQEAYALMMDETNFILYEVDRKDFSFDLPSRYYQLLEYGMTFSNQARMTEQNINPRWGQLLSAGYTHAPLKSIDLGYQWWCDGRLYFPGFLRNQSLSVYGGFQHMSDKNRNYSNKILNPRGISLYAYEISSLRTTYRLPLMYPDQNISSVLYFKGIDGSLFFDMGTARNKIQKQTFCSSGIELTTDTHFFRLTYPIHIGFRTGYETQYKKMFADLIFSIGLSI